MKEFLSPERLAAWGRLVDDQLVTETGPDGRAHKVRVSTPKFSELSKPKKLIADMQVNSSTAASSTSITMELSADLSDALIPNTTWSNTIFTPR